MKNVILVSVLILMAVVAVAQNGRRHLARIVFPEAVTVHSWEFNDRRYIDYLEVMFDKADDCNQPYTFMVTFHACDSRVFYISVYPTEAKRAKYLFTYQDENFGDTAYFNAK